MFINTCFALFMIYYFICCYILLLFPRLLTRRPFPSSKSCGASRRKLLCRSTASLAVNFGRWTFHWSVINLCFCALTLRAKPWVVRGFRIGFKIHYKALRMTNCLSPTLKTETKNVFKLVNRTRVGRAVQAFLD